MKLQGINEYRDQDFEKILHSSPICNKHMHDDYALFEYDSFEDIDAPYDIFHPQNNSGIILLDDDYLFGIRCEHLVWIDGETAPWSYEEEIGCEMNVKLTDAVMLIGNHKGNLKIKLIVFIKNIETEKQSNTI